MMDHAEAGKLGYKKSGAKLLGLSGEKSRRAREAYNSNPIKCKLCGEELPYELKSKHRKFCGHSCAAKFTNAARAKSEPCQMCGGSIGGRSSNRFCSSRCAGEHRFLTNLLSWLTGQSTGRSGPAVSNFVRKYLVGIKGPVCWKCGWSERNPVTGKVPVQVNHIDGNYLHNRPSNLELLCPNCHALTPNFGGLNKGKGRTNRYHPAENGAKTPWVPFRQCSIGVPT